MEEVEEVENMNVLYVEKSIEIRNDNKEKKLRLIYAHI